MRLPGPAANGGGLHHVGYVVQRIDEVAAEFACALGLHWNGEVIHDPIQRVNVSFLEPAAASAARVELVEPAGGDSRVQRFAEQGGGLHHLCYEVDDLEAQLAYMRSLHATLLRSPQPAAAFDGRRIAWVLTRQHLLIEYLERKAAVAEGTTCR